MNAPGGRDVTRFPLSFDRWYGALSIVLGLLSMDHRVTDEIRLEPTPGHTPGHVSVRLASRGADAVITGDLMHHPVQVAEPEWHTSFDTDPVEARETRRAFCGRYADRSVTVLGTRFHHPTAGRIVSHGDAWRFAVAETP
ncbi:MAG: MBL fold metallo-hydrolase [Candidatus Rokuibacteriota bacterium]